MAAQPPLGPRKRSGPALCGADWARGPAPAAALGNGLPPSKRPKGPAGVGAAAAAEDPFGDNDDFTADDLEEIDTIASQALSQDAAGRAPAPASRPQSAWGSAAEPGAGGGAGSAQLRGAFQLQVLQAQHEDTRRKLKETQEEIRTKNGEIKILRDSMQQMEQAMEEQRKSYVLLEQQQSQTLSEKEREFSKKILSLQSELQFKDAEMNELRTRLQNCERSKHVTQAAVTQSPKKHFAIQMKSEGCPPQPARRSFPTKESFNAETAARPSSSSGSWFAQPVSSKEDSKVPLPELLSTKQEAVGKNGSCNSVHQQNIQVDGKAPPKTISPGSALLSALLKQPLVSGSLLGLCHLLSSNSEALPGALLQPDLLETQCTQVPSSRTAQEEDAPLVSLQEAQKLALMGLNLIAMDEGSPAGSGSEVLYLKRCKIRGAVHLLPLVEHHIGAYCRAVRSADKSVNGSCGNHPVVSSRASTNKVSSKEDFRLSLEETTVLSLGILYYLAFYSWDVVHILLSNEVERSSSVGEEQISKMDRNGPCDNKEDGRTQGELPEAPQDAASNVQAQHPLFKKLLQVLAFSATTGSRADSILQQSLKVLVKLAENSTVDLLINRLYFWRVSRACLWNGLRSFQHLLSHQVLLRCLCPAVPLHAVLLTVKLLSILAQHHLLAAQLCSHSDTCLLLALYMYITSRPDKSAPEVHWLQLEQEAVRLLTRCVRCSSPTVLPPAAHCQCNLEVVKALIIMLHRQWMKMRRSESSLCAHKEQIVQFLRDAVLLLHSLSQKDKLFHEHCLEVLHQYDQAVPGIRAILRKTKKLSAREELILDELYPPEPEAEDQGMDSS
ncbi:ATR-interacting protein isoform X3 [Numida meleagris]|uniref:ATR-interacting protein isoform X3 n=1 Tax=Numida meleagris TaxID=8996 RepID=UPI000B3E26B8|nr:ATR-interacting protein isoform X3 [Numida meleagris]